MVEDSNQIKGGPSQVVEPELDTPHNTSLTSFNENDTSSGFSSKKTFGTGMIDKVFSAEKMLGSLYLGIAALNQEERVVLKHRLESMKELIRSIEEKIN